jgi:uncharacterized membrane protein YfcA
MSGTVAPKVEIAELTRADRAYVQEAAVAGAGARRLYLPFPSRLVAGAAVVLLLGMGIVLLAGPARAIPLPSASTLTLYLPVADMSMNVVFLLGVGFVVGVLSGMTGVGGGFLMTPLLMTIGVPSAVAVGTDSAQIAGTASSGAQAHSRLGNVDVKLGLTILVGSLLGGTIGVRVVYFLREMGNYDFWVRIIYVVVLGTVGSLMLRESLRSWMRSSRTKAIQSLVDEGFPELRAKLVEDKKPKEESPFRRFAARLPLQTDYKKAQIRASMLFPSGLGFGVGFLAAIMGVGGGFIMVPSMIYILGIPTHVAVGTDLFQIVFTSTNVAFQQAITNHNVDILLAVILMVGAAIGAQVGARMSGRLEGHQLRTILGIIVVAVMLKLLFELLVTPDSLFALGSAGGGGH